MVCVGREMHGLCQTDQGLDSGHSEGLTNLGKGTASKLQCIRCGWIDLPSRDMILGMNGGRVSKALSA